MAHCRAMGVSFFCPAFDIGMECRLKIGASPPESLVPPVRWFIRHFERLPGFVISEQDQKKETPIPRRSIFKGHRLFHDPAIKPKIRIAVGFVLPLQ